MEGNFILWARQLQYKQTLTTFDQIWCRIRSLEMDPCHHRMRQRVHKKQSTLLSEDSRPPPQQEAPFWERPLKSLTSNLACNCQSASLRDTDSGSVQCPWPRQLKAYHCCCEAAAGCGDPVQIWIGSRVTRPRNTAALLKGFDERVAPKA